MSESLQLILKELRKQVVPKTTITILSDSSDDYSELANFGKHAITNRFDVKERYKKTFAQVHFNDFIFPEHLKVQRVILPVSKEKAQTHYLINQAMEKLPKAGELHLAGMRTEGIKTYIEKIKENWPSCEAHIRTSESGARLAIIRKRDNKGQPLDDSDYAEIQDIQFKDGFNVKSKPGVFGWQKLDQGSELLAGLLPNLERKVVLDLGCGYGYLSIKAAEQNAQRVDATDNNAAAILATQANFDKREISGRVFASDCAIGSRAKYDVIVCNPPFHQGFANSEELTDKFLTQTANLLKEEGEAYFVVNAFIPLAKKAKEYFSSIDEIEDDNQFKVFLLKN